MATFFLRFTDTPLEDLDRGTSLNMSGCVVGLVDPSIVAEGFGCEEDSLIEFDGVYCQVLEGLCGYELSASTIEDAIEEVEDGKWQFSFVGKPVIFKGKLSPDCEYVADGDLFIPFSIAYEF